MKKELHEKQLNAIELLASGISQTDVAKMVGVDTRTITRWKAIPEFREGINIATEEAKKNIDKRIMQYADTILAELYNLATKAKSEKVRLDASTYLINRAAGTPIAKVETREVSDKDKNKEADKELTWEDLEQNEISPSNDKVIDLKNR